MEHEKLHDNTTEKGTVNCCLTLIGAVVEDIEGFHCLFTSLLVTKDQVNPLMKVTGHVFTFLGSNIHGAVIFNSCLCIL